LLFSFLNSVILTAAERRQLEGIAGLLPDTEPYKKEFGVPTINKPGVKKLTLWYGPYIIKPANVGAQFFTSASNVVDEARKPVRMTAVVKYQYQRLWTPLELVGLHPPMAYLRI
jgi:hypothetical protein